MATKYEAADTYTDQEIVDLYRQCLARGAVSGEEYYIGNRRIRFPGVDKALQIIQAFEARAADSSGLAMNYARLNRR